MDEFLPLMDVPAKRLGDCICYLTTLGITIWVALSFNLKGPRCYLQEFYVPALDLSQNTSITPNTTVNPCLFFDLAFENILTDRSVRYGDVNLTFSYGKDAVADYVVPSFYQGKGKTAHRREVVEARGVTWGDAIKAVSNGSTTVFRVDMAARPRFRFWFWYSKKKGVRIGADVEVDGTGMKVKKEDIRLNSAESKRRLGVFVLLSSLLVTLCLS